MEADIQDWLRFWGCVEKFPNSCWLWHEKLERTGYPRFRWTRNGKQHRKGSHVYAYEKCIGPIPKTFEVDHLCKVPSCVNPAHLEAVPKYVNMMRSDCLQAINARKTHCIRGHEFTGTRSSARPDGRSHRRCKACEAIRQGRYLADAPATGKEGGG